jgi:restriction system protein
MARRKQNILDVLLVVPWWASLAMGALVYGILRYGPLMIKSDYYVFKGILSALPSLAPLAAFVFVAGAVGSAIRQLFQGRRLERQTGLGSIGKLSWRQFEGLISEVFRRRGFVSIENSAEGADGGVDLRLIKDGKRTLVQCKQWKTRQVGVKVIRELFGVMAASGASKGSVVTYGDFTREAKDFAAGKPIELISGKRLETLISEVQNSGNLAPVADSSPVCPKCGSGMQLRTAKKGPHSGKKFWGCERYPNCRGITPVEQGLE